MTLKQKVEHTKVDFRSAFQHEFAYNSLITTIGTKQMYLTRVNVYVDLLVFTRIAGNS